MDLLNSKFKVSIAGLNQDDFADGLKRIDDSDDLCDPLKDYYKMMQDKKNEME